MYTVFYDKKGSCLGVKELDRYWSGWEELDGRMVNIDLVEVNKDGRKKAHVSEEMTISDYNKTLPDIDKENLFRNLFGNPNLPSSIQTQLRSDNLQVTEQGVFCSQADYRHLNKQPSFGEGLMGWLFG